MRCRKNCIAKPLTTRINFMKFLTVDFLLSDFFAKLTLIIRHRTTIVVITPKIPLNIIMNHNFRFHVSRRIREKITNEQENPFYGPDIFHENKCKYLVKIQNIEMNEESNQTIIIYRNIPTTDFSRFFMKCFFYRNF